MAAAPELSTTRQASPARDRVPARDPRPALGLEGTGALLHLAWRRDRVVVPAWSAVFVLMAASSAAATVGVYPTVASRVAAATSVNTTPSLVALYGRIYDPTSLGAVAMFKLAGLGAAFIAVFAAATVVRHTRAEEEAGRLELLGSAVVGRSAPLAAALLLATGASAGIGALTALGLMVAGLPARGSVVFGASWAATGLVFAAVAGVAA